MHNKIKFWCSPSGLLAIANGTNSFIKAVLIWLQGSKKPIIVMLISKRRYNKTKVAATFMEMCTCSWLRKDSSLKFIQTRKVSKPLQQRSIYYVHSLNFDKIKTKSRLNNGPKNKNMFFHRSSWMPVRFCYVFVLGFNL